MHRSEKCRKNVTRTPARIFFRSTVDSLRAVCRFDPTKPKHSLTKGSIMASTTAPQANTTTRNISERTDADNFDRKELSRVFSRLRHEVGGLVDDANRKNPFYARSKDEAIAKRNAAVRTLEDFADRIDSLKKADA